MLTIIGLRYVLKTQLCLGIQNKMSLSQSHCYQKTKLRAGSVYLAWKAFVKVQEIITARIQWHKEHPSSPMNWMTRKVLAGFRTVGHCVTGWTLWIKRARYYPHYGISDIWKQGFSPCCLCCMFRKKIMKNELKSHKVWHNFHNWHHGLNRH